MYKIVVVIACTCIFLKTFIILHVHYKYMYSVHCISVCSMNVDSH